LLYHSWRLCQLKHFLGIACYVTVGMVYFCEVWLRQACMRAF
jgi:hypothetical protein